MLRGASSIGTSGGGIGLKSAGVLAQSAVPASVTGTLIETTLATIQIPSGAVGPNGMIRLTPLSSWTNSANSKTINTYLGGVQFGARIQTTSAGEQFCTLIRCRNSQASQVSLGKTAGSAFQSTGSTATTGAVDMTQAQTLTITGTLANTGETITLEGYTVEILNP